jgi:transcriptional regulator with XRE-family HTH domain
MRKKSRHPLREFRQSQCMSQEELAALLGVTVATVSRWETGDRLPDPDKLPLIEEKTGLAPAQLRPDMSKIFGER